MAWVYIFFAGIFEVVWAVSLKYTEGFTRLFPSLMTVAGMIISFFLLSLALKTLPLGTAYTVWTGVGAIGTVILGMIFFGEPHNLMRLAFIGLILSGIIGLKVSA